MPLRRRFVPAYLLKLRGGVLALECAVGFAGTVDWHPAQDAAPPGSLFCRELSGDLLWYCPLQPLQNADCSHRSVPTGTFSHYRHGLRSDQVSFDLSCLAITALSDRRFSGTSGWLGNRNGSGGSDDGKGDWADEPLPGPEGIIQIPAGELHIEDTYTLRQKDSEELTLQISGSTTMPGTHRNAGGTFQVPGHV